MIWNIVALMVVKFASPQPKKKKSTKKKPPWHEELSLFAE